jgi:transcription factor A
MGNKWEKLSEQQKSQYLTQYRKALEEYKHDVQVWEEKMIRLGHIDVVRNEALIEPREHSSRVPHRPRGSKE